jgi:hypothetical protein
MTKKQRQNRKAGSLGGKAIFKKLGKKGMKKLAMKGAEARWGK